MDYKISDEQSEILKNIKEGHNVIVNAVAGSGKSTTILSIAKEMPELRILQITYNSKLRKEFKDKTQSEKLNNIEVHTYHSFATKYYLSDAYNDIKIRAIIQDNMIPRMNKIPIYDLVVLDEVQDCTLLYFRFVVKCIKDMKIPVQLLFLGDYMQMIYEFKGADSRFLTQANDIWKGFAFLKSQEFVFCTLNTSYRITNQMSSFINDSMLGRKCILSCKEGPKVEYIRYQPYLIISIVVGQIKKLIQEGAHPSDFFIISGSLRAPSVTALENALIRENIPCHFPMTDVVEVDERIINGKVAFVTCHTSKGRQRKYVFVMGFDNDYFNYNARSANRNECPNALYVAATRATTRLILLENNSKHSSRSLEFLKMNHFDMKKSDFVDFKGNTQGIYYTPDVELSNVAVKKVSPTDLVRFITESVMESVSPIIDRIFTKITDSSDESMIEIQSFIETDLKYYEDVSNINGIAIPVMYYDHINKLWNPNSQEKGVINKNILYEIIETKIRDMKHGSNVFVKDIFKDVSPVCITMNDYLYISNIYSAIEENLHFKLKQISREEHKWVSEDMVSQFKERLDKFVGSECIHHKPLIEEQIIEYKMDYEHQNIDALLEAEFGSHMKFKFSARTDIITSDCLWELKCTSSISIENLLQTVIYAWLWRLLPHKDVSEIDKKTKIFNVKTGEIFELNATTDELTEVVILLLKGKYGGCELPCDSDFIANCRKSADIMGNAVTVN